MHPDAGQPEPVPKGNLTCHDGIEGAQPAFAGQQIIVRICELAVFQIIADPEQIRVFVVQRLKLHLLRKGVHPCGKIMVVFRQLLEQAAHSLRGGGQAYRQIAAVHGGDEAWLQGLQRAGVIPVHQMAVPLLHFFHGFHCRTDPLRQFICCQQFQPLGGDQGTQVQADVGRGGTVGDSLVGIDLHIVRRQSVILGSDGGLKEQEGTFGQPEKHFLHIAGRFCGRLYGAFQRWDGKGSRRPEGGQCDPRQPKRTGQDAQKRQTARSSHAQVKETHIGFGIGTGKLCCRDPLQQLLAGYHQPVQGPANGIQLGHGLRWQHGNVHKKPEETLPAAPQRGNIQRQQADDQQPRLTKHYTENDREKLQWPQQTQTQHLPYPALFLPAESIARRPELLWQNVHKIGEQLPVAPCPAVQTGQMTLNGFGLSFIEGDIARKGAAAQQSFQQIVAQYSAGNDLSGGRFQKGFRIDDALALKRCFPAHILIKMMMQGMIGVHTARFAQQARKGRLCHMHGGAHAGLQDGDAAHMIAQRPALLQWV